MFDSTVEFYNPLSLIIVIIIFRTATKAKWKVYKSEPNIAIANR